MKLARIDLSRARYYGPIRKPAITNIIPRKNLILIVGRVQKKQFFQFFYNFKRKKVVSHTKCCLIYRKNKKGLMHFYMMFNEAEISSV